MRETMKNLIKNTITSIGIALTVFCVTGMVFDIAYDGNFSLDNYQFSKMVIGCIIVGLGFGAGPFRSGTPTYLPSFVRTFPWWGISRNGYRGGRRRWEESSGAFCSWDAACWPAVSRQRRFRCRRRWDAIQWRDMRRTRRTWRRPPIPIPAAPRAFQ